MNKSHRGRSGALVNVHINNHNEGKTVSATLTVILGARPAGLSVSETADLLGFLPTTVSKVFTQNSQIMRTTKRCPVSRGSLDRNTLLTTEVRGEWPDRLELPERLR